MFEIKTINPNINQTKYEFEAVLWAPINASAARDMSIYIWLYMFIFSYLSFFSLARISYNFETFRSRTRLLINPIH